MNGMYEKLIEKLRKNNRMSGWTHIDRLIDEAAEAIEALQVENEQLKADCDRMCGEAEAGILMEISRRLAAYEDTGLTPEQIEAQQQEIEQLKTRLSNIKTSANYIKRDINEADKVHLYVNEIKSQCGKYGANTTKILFDRLKALTADKDEQTEQMKYLLRRTLPILEVTNDQQELIEQINALLGGKEDV